MHIRLSHTDRLRTLMKAGLSMICMQVPLETIEYFSDVNEIVEVWNVWNEV